MLYIYYYGYSKTSTNRIPLKVVVIITLGESSSNNNTSIAEILEDLQIVIIGQLREIIDQINIGQAVFNKKLKDIDKAKVKLLKVKQFNKI